MSVSIGADGRPMLPRPSAVSDDELARRWAKAFGPTEEPEPTHRFFAMTEWARLDLSDEVVKKLMEKEGFDTSRPIEALGYDPKLDAWVWQQPIYAPAHEGERDE